MVRIGVIGVGLIGKSHLRRYAEIKDVQVVAVSDIAEDEAKRVAAEYNVPDVYKDFRKLLERDDIDAVDVCLHNNFHGPVTIAALQAGKHVYCEKPIAGAYADGRAMVEAAAQTKKMLHIQLAGLYSNETRVAKRIIDDGGLGEIYHALSTGYRRRGRPFVDGYGSPNFVKKEVAGGGALFDMGIYHISEVLYLMGMPKVARISGKTHQKTDMDPKRRAQSGYNVEELAVGLVHFEGGATLDIVEAWAIHLNPFEGSFIAGSKGGIRLRPFSYHSQIAGMDMDGTINLDAVIGRDRRLSDGPDVYSDSQTHWVAALHGRVELLPTAELALQTMLIQEGIYRSTDLGRDVTAAEVHEGSVSTAVKV